MLLTGRTRDRPRQSLRCRGGCSRSGRAKSPPSAPASPPRAPAQMQRFDAAGLVVCPGLIDLHAHLREPGQSAKETIATGTASAARGGFTSVVCMPNTSPAIDNPGTVALIRERAATRKQSQRLRRGRHHQKHRRRGTGAHRLAQIRRRHRHHRRRPLRAEQRTDAPRPGIRQNVRFARHGSLPGLFHRDRRRDARRLLERGPGFARLAGLRARN